MGECDAGTNVVESFHVKIEFLFILQYNLQHKKHELYFANNNMSSSRKPSYSIRFRTFVKELSTFELNNKQTRSAYENTNKTKKRTYEETFGPRVYDEERYGQEIDDTFFETNIGHGVIG